MVTVIKDLSGVFGRKINTLVGHERPDADVFLCFWIALRFGLCIVNPLYRFVRSGERLESGEGDPQVLHVDTGLGEFDTHGKGLGRTCAAALLAERLGIEDLPGIADLLEWVTKIDNAELLLDYTDMSYYILDLPKLEEVKDWRGRVEWVKVVNLAYREFDRQYQRGLQRHQNRTIDLPKYAQWIMTPKKEIRVCTILDRSYLRITAFEAGADVVVWTQPMDGAFHAGVDINPTGESPDRVELRESLSLQAAAAVLRWQEGQKRGLDLDVSELVYWGQLPPVPNWFLYDSNKLIRCGSGTHPLRKEEEFTKLTGEEIVQAVIASLD